MGILVSTGGVMADSRKAGCGPENVRMEQGLVSASGGQGLVSHPPQRNRGQGPGASPRHSAGSLVSSCLGSQPRLTGVSLNAESQVRAPRD